MDNLAYYMIVHGHNHHPQLEKSILSEVWDEKHFSRTWAGTASEVRSIQKNDCFHTPFFN